MDEVMRGLQSDPSETPIVRFGALSVWMVLVVTEIERVSTGAKYELSVRLVMAKVIEFYIPKNFQSPQKWTPQLHLGKVIEFRSEAKKSA